MTLIAFSDNRTQQARYLLSLADANGVPHDQIEVNDDGWEVPSVISDAYTDLAALAYDPATTPGLLPDTKGVVLISDFNVDRAFDGSNTIATPNRKLVDLTGAWPDLDSENTPEWFRSEPGDDDFFYLKTDRFYVATVRATVYNLTGGMTRVDLGAGFDGDGLYFDMLTFTAVGGGAQTSPVIHCPQDWANGYYGPDAPEDGDPAWARGYLRIAGNPSGVCHLQQHAITIYPLSV